MPAVDVEAKNGIEMRSEDEVMAESVLLVLFMAASDTRLSKNQLWSV